MFKVKTMPLHPFLFALYSILFLFHHNAGELRINVTFYPILVVLFSIGILLVILFILSRNIVRAAVATSIAVFTFFFFGHFCDFLKYAWHFQPQKYDLYHYAGLLLTPAIFLIYKTLRTKRSLKDLNFVLNGITLILLSITVFQIIAYNLKEKEYVEVIKPDKIVLPARFSSKSELPDIYYIIADGYTSSEILKKYYKFDNSSFISHLRKKGFYVPEKSKSNYIFTLPSLSSSLNMKYINYLSDELGADSHNLNILFNMIQDNKVAKTLKSLGYKHVNYCSGYGPLSFNPYADENIMGLARINEFGVLLLKTTLLKVFFYDQPLFKKQFLLPTILRLLSYNVDKDSPKFVTAHLISPHPPFIFHEDGSLVDHVSNSLIRWREKDRYIDEVKYINSRLKTLIDNILQSKSKVQPVIILQADHGSFSEDKESRESKLMRTGILNAYYAPERCRSFFYDSITPVNTFRIVFKCLFEKNYEILKDKTYWNRVLKPYVFEEVSFY